MKAELIAVASAVVPNEQILINMISRRVRQLCFGHRPMVDLVPGMGHADIALMEVAQGKLAFESTFGQNGSNAAQGAMVEFPGIIVASKTNTKKAA